MRIRIRIKMKMKMISEMGDRRWDIGYWKGGRREVGG